MKDKCYQRRRYRQWVRAVGLFRRRIAIDETDIQLYSDREIEAAFLTERIKRYRRQIADYVSIEPRFFSALKPIAIATSAAPIVKAMGRVAYAANVGPMASVAGAIAQFLGRDLLRRGCREVIIENGGDIFLATRRPRIVRIYCGRKSPWNALGVIVRASEGPVGICTSSATIGHSLSFGCADAAVVCARTATLADAVATASCNRIHEKSDLPKTLTFARGIRGVMGAVFILKSHLATWGNLELKGSVNRFLSP